MGICYFAYAFDADQVERAVADPHSILSSDPLADAWGLEPHATCSIATFEQVSAARDMPYVDKAWSGLQALTRRRRDDGSGGASLRMFDGHVTFHDRGWDPWVRTLVPEEIPAIRDDLCAIDESVVQTLVQTRPGPHGPDEEYVYLSDFLGRAQIFVARLAEAHRGMVYLIG